MTAKETFQINILGGIRQDIEDPVNPGLVEAENVYYDRNGGLRKRFGYETILNPYGLASLIDPGKNWVDSSLYVTSEADDPEESTSVDKGVYIFNHGGSLVRTSESKLYADGFTFRSLIPNAVAFYDPVTSSTNSLVGADISEATYVVGGISKYVVRVVTYRTEVSNETDNPDNRQNIGDLRYSVYVDDKLVIDRRSLGSDVCSAKLVATDNHIIVVYAKKYNASDARLLLRGLKLASPGNGFGVPSEISLKYGNSGLSASSAYVENTLSFLRGFNVPFDVCEYSKPGLIGGNKFLLAYVVADGTSPIRYWPEIQRVQVSEPGGGDVAYDNSSSILLWNTAYKLGYLSEPINTISISTDKYEDAGYGDIPAGGTANQSKFAWLMFGKTNATNSVAVLGAIAVRKDGIVANTAFSPYLFTVHTSSGTTVGCGIKQLAAVADGYGTTVGSTPSASNQVCYAMCRVYYYDNSTSVLRYKLVSFCYGLSSSYSSPLTTYTPFIGRKHTADVTNAMIVAKPWLYDNVPYAPLYVHTNRADETTGSSHIVVDMMLGSDRYDHLSGDIARVSLRPVCNIAPRQLFYLGYAQATRTTVPITSNEISGSLVSGSNVTYAGVTSPSTTKTSGICSVSRFRISHQYTPSSCSADNTSIIAGGVPWKYDGSTVSELGFIRPPSIIYTYESANSATDSSTGKHYYKAVYEWIDANGNVSQSESSDIYTATKTTKTTVVQIAFDRLTLRMDRNTELFERNPIKVSLYRSTLDSDANFYRVTTCPLSTRFSNQNLSEWFYATGTIYFEDDVTDANLVKNEMLYEADGAILSNVSPPSATLVAVHKSRVWLAGTPDDSIWFSKSFVPGVEPGFNEVLTVLPFEGGRVTGLASLDDYLVIFKENSVWFLQGDGPDASGAGSSLGTPIRIVEGIGAVPGSKVIVADDSVFFQSIDGIFRLRRGSNECINVSHAVKKIVSDIANAQSLKVVTAAYDTKTNIIRFSLVNDIFSATPAGYVLNYHLENNAWTTYVYRGNDDFSDGAPVILSSCMVNNRWVALNHINVLMKESTTSKVDYDGNRPFSMSIKTGWIRLSGVAGYQRVQRIIVTGERVGDSMAEWSMSVIHNGNVYETPVSRSLATTTNAGNVEVLEYPVKIQRSDMFKVVLAETTDNSQSNGETMILTGVTVYGSRLRGRTTKGTNISRKRSGIF